MTKNMVEFGPSVKTFNDIYLYSSISVDTKRVIVNKNYVFIPKALTKSINS